MERAKPSSSAFARIIILGNSGFIGSSLQRYFRENLPQGVDVIGKNSAESDLTNEESVQKLAREFDEKTVVIMCSAIKRQRGEDTASCMANISMTMNLCRALQDKPVGRFVYLSSTAVYGEDVHNVHITEQTCPQPTSFYGIAKYTSELLLKKVFSNTPARSLLILRPAVVYGSGEKIKIYGPSGFIRSALDHEKITLWGDATEKRDFISIDDLAAIIFKLTFAECSGPFNIATGTSHSFLEVLQVIERLAGHKLETDSRPRSKDKVDHAFDVTALKKHLPDFAFTDLTAGIGRNFRDEAKNA